MSKVSEAASEVMWHLVTHSAHGYSQPNRHGTGGPSTADYSAPGGEVIDVPGWGKVRIHSGDYDCSEAAIDCYGFLGIPVGGATYTGNERECLVSTGLFRAYRAGSVTPLDGDILLREGHTEMVINDARWQAGFRRSENHSITGRTGDQDGYESTYSALDIGAWEWVIRYVGPDAGPNADSEEEKLTDADIERIADLAARKVWSYAIQGTQAQDRLYGIDAIQLPKATGGIDRLNRTDDPTGRNQQLDTHDHVKWIAKAVSDIASKLGA